MLTVGNLLKKAREHSGKQIEEISQSTRIKPEYLHKIEQNDFKDFTSSTFVKGFIRSYATFLGLDAENIVALFRRQIGEEDVPLKPKQRIFTSAPGIVLSPATLMTIVVVIFFVCIFTFLIIQFYKLQQPPTFVLTAPAGSTVSVSKAGYEIKGYTEANTTVLINDTTQLQLHEDNTFSLLVDLKEGENTFKFTASKKNIEGGKKNEKIIVITYTPGGKPTISPTTSGAQPSTEGTITAELTLSGTAWIQVVSDGVQKAVGQKDSGYKLTFAAAKTIDITTGKPNISIITIDGKQKAWRIANGIGYLTCTKQDNDWTCE